ncbi:hypothetical protein C6P42_005159, partial [Pichia californica]
IVSPNPMSNQYVFYRLDQNHEIPPHSTNKQLPPSIQSASHVFSRSQTPIQIQQPQSVTPQLQYQQS